MERTPVCRLGPLREPEVQWLTTTRHLTYAVSVGVEIAGVIQNLIRLPWVVVEVLVAEVGDPCRVSGRRVRRSDIADPERDAFEQHVAVDRVEDCVTDVEVLERRMTVADSASIAIQCQLGKPTLQTGDRDDVVVASEQFKCRGRNLVGGVDFTALQRSSHRVTVGKHPKDELLDAVVTPIPVGILDHRPVLARSPFLERVLAGGDSVERFVILGDFDALVDVLRDDVHIHRRQLGVGHRTGDFNRPAVDHNGVEVGRRGRVVVPLLIT